MYIDHFANKQDKEEGQLLVKNIRSTFEKLIQSKDWIDDETKPKALEKLKGIKAIIGWSDWLADDDLFAKEYHFLSKSNLTNLAGLFDLAFYYHESWMADKFEFIGKPVDRDHWWSILPFRVSTSYSPIHNKIVVPVAILCQFFFNESYPKYVKYGQLGVVTAHELTHTFDDYDSQTDVKGNIVDWWTRKTREKIH